MWGVVAASSRLLVIRCAPSAEACTVQHMPGTQATNHAPMLAITAGDPLGIGPEVTLKALAAIRAGAPRVDAQFKLFGHEPTFAALAAQLGIAPFWTLAAPAAPGASAATSSIQLVHRPFTRPAGAGLGSSGGAGGAGPTREGGRHSFDLLVCAIEDVKRGDCAGIVTAPIAKEAWAAAGVHYPGHTEVLAHEFESPRSAMLFVGPALRVILATTHIPLAAVPRVLTTERVLECIELGAMACTELGVGASGGPGARRPRIAVAGLNPHAGERGLLGEEDERVIAPAVARARAAGIDAVGPLPGDTVFLAAAKGRFDLVVAMYHDQGLIPVKLLDRERAVNVTTGLSWGGHRVVRTSPAHGTAYDIAGRGGQGAANAESMIEAIVLAARQCSMA